ncbi:uncharacterized protein [Rutidosis leptorrhynchoides]|uniref:uncharacterized protein n=1 Tax=Rutidosis leptorrhynchoides TaxID=125765 RepID=UPI003A994BE8
MANNQEFVALNMLNNELVKPSIRIKVFSLWERNYWTSPNVLASIEMVFIDAQGNKIAATIPKKLIAFFRRTFVEGSFLDLTGFGVIEYEEKNYRMAPNEWKVVLMRQTIVRRAAPFEIREDGFFPVPYVSVNDWDIDGLTAFDVMGQLIANSPIEVKWDKGIAKKSLSFFLRDLGGTRIKCLLWSTLAEQLYQYLEAHREDGSLIICLINNCKLRDFNGPQVSNQMYGCRVFIDQDIRPINAFKTVLPIPSLDLSSSVYWAI